MRPSWVWGIKSRHSWTSRASDSVRVPQPGCPNAEGRRRLRQPVGLPRRGGPAGKQANQSVHWRVRRVRMHAHGVSAPSCAARRRRNLVSVLQFFCSVGIGMVPAVGCSMIRLFFDREHFRLILQQHPPPPRWKPRHNDRVRLLCDADRFIGQLARLQEPEGSFLKFSRAG